MNSFSVLIWYAFRMNNFFEGKDFKNSQFRALIPSYYPAEYQNYISEEIKLLKQIVKTKTVLEAGVGIGRLIPILAPFVKKFVGVDNALLMLQKAKSEAHKFKNVEIIEGNLENLSSIFSKNYFDTSLCLWNTLGNVEDEVRVLKELLEVTKDFIIITVYKKGMLEQRKNWYRTVGISIKEIDEKNEIFFSHSGLRSKSYSIEDIKEICKKVGLTLKDHRVLSGVMLWAELVKVEI